MAVFGGARLRRWGKPRVLARAASLFFLGTLALITLCLWQPWHPGIAAAASPSAGPPVYRLPWKGGQRIYVLQGQNQGSHTGVSAKYAYDFASGPFDGTSFQVLAARSGRVAKIVQEYTNSPDCDTSYNSKANYVLLDHGDGMGSLYLHLAQGGIIPKPGAWVNQGEPLGQTGHTGWVCGPTHLHFTVLNIKTWESLDAPFSDRDTLRGDGRPRTGQWYISDNGVRTYTVGIPYAARRWTSGR